MSVLKQTKPIIGMRINDNSTVEELSHWRRMYENPFFHRDYILTDGEIQEYLTNTPGPPSGSVSPEGRMSPFPKLPPRARTPTLHINQAHYTGIVRDHFKNLPNKRQDNASPCDDKNTEKTIPLNAKEPVEVTIQPCEGFTTKRSGRPLLRRPLPPDQLHLTGSPHDQDSILMPVDLLRQSPDDYSEIALPMLLNEERLDAWKTCSFTTMFPDNPVDPDSYYNTHFPTLLQKIPRRKKRPDEDFDDWFCPISQTPDMCVSFFRMLPGKRLSSPQISEMMMERENVPVPGMSSLAIIPENREYVDSLDGKNEALDN